MNWFSSSGFIKAAVESATNLTKSLIQDDFVEDSDADESPSVPRLSKQPTTSNVTEDEESVGITPQLIEFVHNVLLYPKTFTDFPLDAQIKDQIILAEWQEKHARMIIQRVPELDAVRTKLGPKLLETTFKKSPPTENQNTVVEQEQPQLNKSSNSNPSSPTAAKIPNSLLLPLSPILDLMNSNEAVQPSPQSPRVEDLEEYFENLLKEDLNSSLESLDQHPNYIDPEKDNYFVMDVSFEDFVKGKVTSYPPSPKKLSPRPKNEKSIPSKAAKVIRSLTASLLDDSTNEIQTQGLTKSASGSLEVYQSANTSTQEANETISNPTEQITAEPMTQESSTTVNLTEQTAPEPITQESAITEHPNTQEPAITQQEKAIAQEDTTPQEPSTSQDTPKEVETSQDVTTATVSNPSGNESLQDVISSLMQEEDASTSPPSSVSIPSTTLTTEPDDDSFMNWQ